MSLNTNKIKLSPRLRWGVGRDIHQINFFKIGGIIFLILSFGLITRAGYMLFQKEQTDSTSPQVLGVSDTNTSSQVFTEYKIKKGDTLFTISKEYGLEWTTLATLNNLQPPFDLKIGQSLKIPKQ